MGFERPCISPDACEELSGTPVIIARLPGVAAAYPDDVAPGVEIRTVAVQKDKVVLRITAYLYGKPDRIKLYEQIFGYMISTLKIEP